MDGVFSGYKYHTVVQNGYAGLGSYHFHSPKFLAVSHMNKKLKAL